MMSVVCPSFRNCPAGVGPDQGIQANYRRIRRLSVLAGALGRHLGIGPRSWKPGEDLAGMRVVVQIDGGRSRLRENNGKNVVPKAIKNMIRPGVNQN